MLSPCAPLAAVRRLHGVTLDPARTGHHRVGHPGAQRGHPLRAQPRPTRPSCSRPTG
ncbi:MAG: hypothetical protein R2838_14215 [Caldilineaceae bacterium]